MEQNTIYTLPVLDMNSEGTGICKQDGMVIFVPRTVPGDYIRLQICTVRKNFAAAECREILTPSEHRREPECPFHISCGGCTLQHVSRKMELSVKENTVRQALRRMHLESCTRNRRHTEIKPYSIFQKQENLAILQEKAIPLCRAVKNVCFFRRFSQK